MRITIRIDDQLHAEAKKRAAEKGTTLTSLIEDSLREGLARWKPAHRRKRFRMITLGGKAYNPALTWTTQPHYSTAWKALTVPIEAGEPSY